LLVYKNRKDFQNMCVCSESSICKACEAAKNGVPNVLFIFFLLRKRYKSYFGMSFEGKHNAAKWYFMDRTLSVCKSKQ